jgi:hypothetical protein
MRKPHLALLLACIAVVPYLWTTAHGQTPIQPQVLQARQRQIVIPFDPDPAEAHRLKQLQLYYSTDQGRSWRLGATAYPDQKKFNFVADRDGLFLFAVQTTDLSGRNYPEKMENATPALRVNFDTGTPAVNDAPYQAAPLGVPVNREFLNTKRISLKYEITEKGPSGISDIDLWYTTDGRSWALFPRPKTAIVDLLNGPVTFDVDKEGVYGFTILPRSGVGTSAQPPVAGEKPQIWLEVDTTKPAVELQKVQVGDANHKDELKIFWHASDKNLGKEPIKLYYGTTPTGPWVPIISNLPNAGYYVWSMPVSTGLWQFYLKVEAVDLANNVGEAISRELIKVDMVLPRAKISSVHPGG